MFLCKDMPGLFVVTSIYFLLTRVCVCVTWQFLPRSLIVPTFPHYWHPKEPPGPDIQTGWSRNIYMNIKTCLQTSVFSGHHWSWLKHQPWHPYCTMVCKTVCLGLTHLWLWGVMLVIHCANLWVMNAKMWISLYLSGIISAYLLTYSCTQLHNISDVVEYLSEREKETFATRGRGRQKECLLQYLHRWNGCVGGRTCECRLLGAVSGKWVLSGKRRAALVRQSAPRPAERQSRFHGFSLFSVLAQRQSSR